MIRSELRSPRTAARKAPKSINLGGVNAILSSGERQAFVAMRPEASELPPRAQRIQGGWGQIVGVSLANHAKYDRQAAPRLFERNGFWGQVARSDFAMTRVCSSNLTPVTLRRTLVRPSQRLDIRARRESVPGS